MVPTVENEPSPARASEWWARCAASFVFLAAAGATVRGIRGMSGGMAMPGGWTMSMMWMVMPGGSIWSAAGMFLLMWQAMMIAMMLPSSWPMLALYRRVALFREIPRVSLGTLLVGTGYFTVWLAFGVAAFAAGIGASTLAMHSRGVSEAAPRAAGIGLVLAGIYQLTPLKQTCLKHCREPVFYLSHAWKPGLGGSLRLGLHHGAFCAACCWALMAIQILLGVMNLAVMIVIAAIIGAEKLWVRGPWLSRVVGIGSIAVGIWSVVKTPV